MRRFHAPSGRFDGVIGGPPCQAFSTLRHLVLATGGKLAPNLIPEYERVVGEAAPTWFLMENVPEAPEPVVPGYVVRSLLIDNRQAPAEPGSPIGAEQRRVRRFSFGTRDGIALKPRVALFESPRKSVAVLASSGGGACDPEYDKGNPNRMKNRSKVSGGAIRKGQGLVADVLVPQRTVIANPGREFTTHHHDGKGGRKRNGGEQLAPLHTVTANGTSWDAEKKRPRSFRSHAYFVEACRLQGLPEGFDIPPFTVEGKIRAVGNGVPITLGRAIARAVREALGLPLVTQEATS